MFNIFAHAGERHESAAVAAAHEIPWFIQLPLFVGLIMLFALIVWQLSKKTELTVLLTSALLLISGIGFYEAAPAISIVAITAGLFSTLFITLVGLGPKPSKK